MHGCSAITGLIKPSNESASLALSPFGRAPFAHLLRLKSAGSGRREFQEGPHATALDPPGEANMTRTATALFAACRRSSPRTNCSLPNSSARVIGRSVGGSPALLNIAPFFGQAFQAA